MKKQIKRKIYLLSNREMKPIEVVQYETGVQLIFEVQDTELDTTAMATLFVRKPSGKFVFQEDNISLMGNTVVIDLHNQAITEYGHPFFQIKFKKEEEVISTYSGMLTVEKSLDDSGAEESKTFIAAFNKLTDEEIAKIEEATQTQIDLMKAEIEAKGEAVLATIPDEYTEMYNRVNTLFNSVANAIKGTVSGSVVRVDDVSPVEHKPVVKVHGKNLVPYGTITFTKNKNCLLDKPIPPGTYVISAKITSSDTDGEFSSVSINSGNEVLKYLSLRRNERVSATFTTTKPITNIDFCAAYNYSQGENDTATWVDIQIEEGTTATEYTPYIDPATVTVSRCGKNLFNRADSSRNLDDCKAWGQRILNSTEVKKIFKPGKTYTISFEAEGLENSEYARLFASDVGFSLYCYSEEYSMIRACLRTSTKNEDWLVVGKKITYTNTLTIPEGFEKADYELFGYTQRAFDDEDNAFLNRVKFNYIQIELNETPTDYENYNGTEHTPSSDGTVEGITSLSPAMTLLTDTEGITLECEYNKDTGKVIEKLTNAVVALGGNV